MIKIDSTSYPIVISENILVELSSFIEEYYEDYRILILVDINTEEHCLPLLGWVENNKLNSADTLCIPVGEESKSIEIIAQLGETLLEIGATRKTLLLNLGGGVVSDLGGFFASTFKRGIPFINLPTTLLAMVDASSGGKTGVNLGVFKNQLGTFANPKSVFCGLEFLETLPSNELVSGHAEALKHGLIADDRILHTIKDFNLTELPTEEYIASSISIKNDIVLQDPFENGARKKLNFGHTVGHAFESLALRKEKPLLHGEAVAVGIVVESFLSVFHSKLKKVELDEIKTYIFSQFEKYNIEKSEIKALIELMHSDKKNDENGINFTLLTRIGACEINFNLTDEDVSQALEWYIGI